MFPGLFSFSELIDLDVRDFKFWVKMAQRKVLEDHIARCSASLLPHTSPDHVRQTMWSFEWALKMFDKEK